MNNRWTARIIGLVMLIIFLLLMANLQKQLMNMQRNRTTQPAPTATR